MQVAQCSFPSHHVGSSTRTTSPPNGDGWTSNGGTSRSESAYRVHVLIVLCSVQPRAVRDGLQPLTAQPHLRDLSNTQTANVNYFVSGAGYSSTCATAPCDSAPCLAGGYLSGCGSTPGNPGSCSVCTN